MPGEVVARPLQRLPHLLRDDVVPGRAVEGGGRVIASEDVQLQSARAVLPGRLLDRTEERAAESGSPPGLDDLDVVEERDIGCASRVVESHTGAADGLAVGIDAPEEEHSRRFQPVREQLRILVASTLHSALSWPSTGIHLLVRVVFRDRGQPLVEFGQCHLSHRHLRHEVMLTRFGRRAGASADVAAIGTVDGEANQ